MNQLADLIWEDWSADLPAIQSKLTDFYGPQRAREMVQESLRRTHPNLLSSKALREKRQERDAPSVRSVRRAAERVAAVGRPLVRSVSDMSDRVRDAVREASTRLAEKRATKIKADKVARDRVRQAKPSPHKERLKGSPPNCKERPESRPLKHKGRGGSKVDYIPWCDEGSRRRR